MRNPFKYPHFIILSLSSRNAKKSYREYNLSDERFLKPPFQLFILSHIQFCMSDFRPRYTGFRCPSFGSQYIAVQCSLGLTKLLFKPPGQARTGYLADLNPWLLNQYCNIINYGFGLFWINS